MLMHNIDVEHISDTLREKNIQLDTIDPVVQGGFTQVPNFILDGSIPCFLGTQKSAAHVRSER